MMVSVRSETNAMRRKSDDEKYFALEDAMHENEVRCKKILKCKRQIDYWKSKLDVLEKEQTIHIKLARLRIDAKSTWRSLSPRDRMEKKFILAAMESEKIPTVLDDFPNSNLPPSIRMDKDILLARVARHDFQAKYKYDRFYVPTKLRGDKEVMMAIIPKHSSVVEYMSNALRNDDDIFQALLSSSSTLPPYVVQHFSERIRSDRKKMLQLCAHPDNTSGLSFVSPNLRNDKSFMLEAIEAFHSHHSQNCEAITRNLICGRKEDEKSEGHDNDFQILRYASQQLQNDSEVVLAAVKKSGLNLKYASYNLRRDFTTVMTATEENGEAFRYCLPGEAKDRLLSDRDLVLNRIIKDSPNHTILRTCLDRYKTDQEILLAALESGVDWCLVPCDLQESREFVKLAISRNPCLYLELSYALKRDVEIVSSVIKCDKSDNNVLLEATKQCPNLFSDHEAMLNFAKRGCPDILFDALLNCPMEILGDKSIMLEAIKSSYGVYELCSEELALDRDIVLAALKSHPAFLCRIPDSYQVENPDIVIHAIESCDRNDSWYLYEDVCEEMWSNRDVARSWLIQFGDWLPDDFPDEFEEDEEMCLTLVEQNWAEFENFSTKLKNNKDFMLKAVARDARVVRTLEDTGNQLRYDEDLTLLAFSRDKRAIQSYSGGEDFEYMVSLTESIRKRIEDYETFKSVFCANVLGPNQNMSNCFLSLLNQGPEAVKYHTHLIASYVGLPDEEELQMLHAASNNLLHWGF